MEVQIEEAGPSRKTVRITVSKERIQRHLEELYKSAGQRVQMKGFRPGKVPKHVIKAKLGDAILADAKESLINETFREALKAEGIDVVGKPKLDVGEEPLQEDNELSYSVEVELRPDVEVGDVRSIEVRRQSADATDDDLDGALDELAQAKRKLQSVEDELEAKDFAKVDISYELDGAEIVKKQGLQINPSIAIRGCDPDEFRGKLVGQKKGDKVMIPIEYPDTFEKEEARGKAGQVVITIQDTLRFVSPPIDDELAKSYQADSLADLKKRLTRNISAEKQRREETRIEEEILDQLYAEHPFQVPEGLVADEAEHRARSYVEDLKRQGASDAEAKKHAQEARSQIEEGARKGVRNLFLVEAVMKKHKLFVTEGDVEAELKRIADENQTTLVEVRKYVEDKGLLPEIRLEIMNRKVREYLRKTASMTDS